MAHMVLARKWRPKKFSDLVGQQNTVTILANILAENRLHHAYLLTGTRGVGKTTIARIIAKALNCLNLVQNEPCCVCDNCLQIDKGRFVDVIEIDAASNTGVDNIREVIENAQYTPTSGKYKVFIIDEVHMLSKSAFNAMLKTLEEPPPHIIFVLATTDPQKVPITVISRCLQLKLRNLSAEEIATHLQLILKEEQYSSDIQAIHLLANAANGSMRDALSLTDQAIAFSQNNQISQNNVLQMLGLTNEDVLHEIITAIINRNANHLIKIADRLNQDGANFENILQQIQQKIFAISINQLTNEVNNPELTNIASQISLQDTQLYFDIINLGLEQISKIPQKYTIFTMTLFRIIAFTIGSQEEKNIIIQANNCTINRDSHIVHQPVQTNFTQAIPESTNTITQSDEETTTNQHSNLLEQQNSPGSDNTTQPSKTIRPFTNWINFVAEVDLDKITASVAAVINNFEQLGDVRDNTINLNISTEFQPLVTSDVVDSIEIMLENLYQDSFDLNINFVNQPITNSNNQIQKNLASQKQAQAEEIIEQDPIIQSLKSKFSAKIIPSSIKPL